MLYILTIADRGLVSHAQAFHTRSAAEERLIEYLKENEAYDGSNDADDAWRWLEEHDERLSVEITEQADDFGAGDSMTALRRIYDILYLDLKGIHEFYNEDKAWDADTLTSIAGVVRPFFPRTPTQTAEADVDELTPKDRAEFVRRIEQVSPYDEGLDAEANMVSPSDFLTDLLTDIRHYCDARGVDFAVCDRSAYGHYVNERHEGSQPASKSQDMSKGGDVGCS